MRDMKPSGKLCPREFFSVSDQVSYLEPEQTRALEDAFRNWKDGARRMDSVRARTRLWLLFLMVRHTGARLGEILALDDATAFAPEGPFVRLGREERPREVPLPEDFFAELAAFMESPMGYGLRGELFRVDPGYFRRICYERGKECGLSKDLVCPKSLRNTRAVEMLRGGVPITIVKEVLGQSSLDLTANFQQFSSGDVQSIVRTAHEAMRKRTSARNSFVGHVVEVQTDEVMAQVVLETRSCLRISAVITMDSLRNLKIVVGSPVIATVKAPLVNVLRREGHLEGSARNRLEAETLRVTSTPVLSEVLGRLPDGSDVCALISAQSAEDLDLKAGDPVEFWFKALSVVLNTVQL
ncbi:MAG: TOBE domain-containing protein [Pseudodesulfovibrio sp.]|uniref:Integrase n=1 Tax=Pseudodesulfovibrio indicus TaxID=1716143 RepID=A0A126QP41_9BACT|nr:TOBE domain-containing protein [Pseudodesulfovibrio indicus]AMK11526.1 integrase [Pseudodesulfovibrio indicus]TDT89927.1 molybdate transport system regulatory protein [Pseudodesulfovibrio indicus]